MSYRVAVVGAGVTGLVAARSLTAAGAEVTLVERSSDPGGQVRTVRLGDHRVDVGAEAIHMAGPQVDALLEELGLSDRVVVAETSWTWIWAAGRLRRLPAGVGPAGPTRIAPLARSRLLGPGGTVRAALEPLVPGRAGPEDVAVGEYLGGRFGRQVRDRLVDPLLGGLHAGDVSRLSLQAATPHLAAAVRGRRSLLLGARRRPGAGRGAPSFGTFEGGLDVLVRSLLRDAAATVETGVAVERVQVDGSRVDLVRSDGARASFDATVLAVPAHVAASLLAPDGVDRRSSCPDLGIDRCGTGTPADGPGVEDLRGDRSAHVPSGLSGLRAASVVTVVAAYPRAAVDASSAFDATGILVPSGEGRFLKAATFLSRKWAHLRDPDVFLVRMSAGRAGGPDVTACPDPELVERLHADLADATGLRAEPVSVHVQRWPQTMAQLEVGHLDRLAAIRSALPGHGRVVLAGAPYEGVGIASCIGSGRAAAARVLDVDRAGVGSPA